MLRELRERDPELPVVIASGYDNENVAKRLGHPTGTEFVQKLYGPEDLIHSVRRVLAD